MNGIVCLKGKHASPDETEQVRIH